MSDLRILVSASDRSVRALVREAIEDAHVIEATDEPTTTALAKACRPDLFVVDARDASMSTIQAIRKNLRTSGTLIIHVLDAVPDEGATALLGGADDYVVFPADADELAARFRLAALRLGDRRRSNPLTGLPANDAVSDEITVRLARGDRFACLYIDLDGFKAFNDAHGFVRGDATIRAAASCIVSAVEEHAPEDRFVGHLGGDDFVVIVPPSASAVVAEAVVDGFDAADCTISVGVVSSAERYDDAAGLAEAAAAAKGIAKGLRGSAWATRAGPGRSAGDNLTAEL